MKNLNIENIGRDQFNDEVGSNVIRIDLADTIIDCPMIAPHQSEVKQAKASVIKLNTKLIQYVHRVENSKRINTKKN